MQTTPFIAVPASPPLTDVEFCAWIAQAEPGETIEYHAGALAMDRLRGVSKLPRAECDRVNALADCAFAAAERGLDRVIEACVDGFQAAMQRQSDAGDVPF